MTNATMARLAKLPNIVGVKDATNDLARPLKMRVEIGAGFLPAVGRGRDRGRLPGAGRRRLHLGDRQCRAAAVRGNARGLAAGDLDGAQQINERLIPLHDALFVETSPAPVKYAASLLGRCTRRGAPAALAPIAGPKTQEKVRAGDAGRRAAQLMTDAPGQGPKRETATRRAEPARAARLPDRGHARGGRGPARHRGQVAAQGQASIAESLCRREGGELYLVNANIPEYKPAHFNHQPPRPRKLLLHRKQMNRLLGAISARASRSCRCRSISTTAAAPRSSSASPSGKRKADKRQAEKRPRLAASRARLLRDRG